MRPGIVANMRNKFWPIGFEEAEVRMCQKIVNRLIQELREIEFALRSAPSDGNSG